MLFQKNYSQEYEYKTISTIESVVKTKKLGLGGLIAERSRMIAEAEGVNFRETTTLRLADQEEEKQQKKKKGENLDRSEIRTKQYEETLLLNFYNQFGIRFQNIATNDAIITSKINDLASQGWELAFVSGSAEAMSGYDDPNGIIYTRYVSKSENTVPLITILNDCILCCFKNSTFLSLSYFSPICFIPIDEYTIQVFFDASRKEIAITMVGKKIKIFQ